MKAHRLLFCIALLVLSSTIARAQGITISGTIYNDANGLSDNTINGTPLARYVYAHAFDPVSGIVIASVKIPATSTYSFTGLTPNTTYGVAVSVQYPVVGSPRPSNLENFIYYAAYTGEGVATEGDGIPDGVTSVSLGTQDLSGVNFGIDFLPHAGIVSSTQVNPGNTTQAQVPTLIGDDPEDGQYNGISGTNTVVINSLPTVGTLFYKGVPVVTGDIIRNYNPTQLTLDPPNGNVTVKFTYRVVDAAGQVSNQPAEVTMYFGAPMPTISGKVFHDANGLTDNTVNGNPSNTTRGQFPVGPIYVRAYYPCRGLPCYVQQAVAADGTYSIQVPANTTYSVRLTNNITCIEFCGLSERTVGEHIGDGPGSDGTADGQIQVAIGTNPVTEVNFGFEYQPTANDIIIASQPNPLGTTQVQVPILTGSDPEDGVYNGISGTNTVRIYPVINDNYVVGYGPTFGTLYYDGIPVTNGQLITNYNPAKLTIDPKDGNVTVKFQFRQVDAAGVESFLPATVTMPFSDTVSQLDFGDASDTYSTNLFNNGPRHTIVNGLRLGTLIDAEGGGQFNGNQFDQSATGDNINGINDEDGVTSFPALFARQTAYSVTVAITNTTGADATLSGWIDFNRDQTFSNSERTQVTVPTGATSVTLTWTSIPWSADQFGLVGSSFARFRLASVASEVDNPTDQAYSGEVEDYALTIQQSAFPVNITLFQGQWVEGQGNQLSWSTAWERDNDRFEIQSSRDAKSFESIGRLTGKGTTTAAQTYTFVDVQPLADLTYYRLKQIDIDSQSSYSKIISIRRGVDQTDEELLVYPNPVSDLLRIQADNQQNIADITIYTALGRQVLHQAGSNSTMSVRSLPAGVYVLEVKTLSGQMLRQRFVKQ